MFTPRNTTRHSTPRRRLRRWGVARRGWSLQKLEPRCVMAADLNFGDALAEQTSAEFFDAIDDPSVSAWIHTKPLVASEDDASQVGEPLDTPDRTQPTELISPVDLFSDEAVDLKVLLDQTLVLDLDQGQLDALFGSGQWLSVQVAFDSTLWELVSAKSAPGEVNDPGLISPDSEQVLTGNSIRIVSLADQAARLTVAVQLGSDETGLMPQLTITLSNGDDSKPAGQWQEANLGMVSSGSLFDTFAPTDSLRNSTNEPSDKGFLEAIEIGLDGDGNTDVPANTTIGDEVTDTQTLDESNGSPLPESRRENPERSSRLSRRTLDIRSASAANWSSHPSTASRARVTSGSLATQAALASVYENDISLPSDGARWMIDPKPARLQVAKFLLSRTDTSGASVAIHATKPAAARTQSSTESALVTRPKTPTEMTKPDGASEESFTYVSARPSDMDVTVIEPNSDNHETIADPSVASKAIVAAKESEDPTTIDGEPGDAVSDSRYARIVDRLLSSPISLVAILGLTIAARVVDTEESIQP